MLLTKREALFSILYGVVIMAFPFSTPFCEGKFHQPNSFVVKNDASNGLPAFEPDGSAKDELTHPSPAYPPHISPVTARALSVDTAGGGRKTAAKSVPKSTWNELVPFLGVWYGCNVVYGMMTKSLLTKAYYPWTIATIQMMSGAVCQLPLWYFGKRMIPKLDKSDIKSLFPIALCQFGIHAGATIATGITKGLALAHIIKALEPMCTMGVDHILAMRDIPVERFLGIIPLVAGSILPFWKHVSFDWLSMVAALIVVASSSTRVVLCRRILSDSKEGTNLDPSNLFAILSVMTSALFVPLAFCFDGLGFVGALTEISQFESIAGLLGRLCMSGFLYYMFHVASFDLMTKVTPVTHAVANLMRRPAVMLLFAFLDTVQQLARNIPVKWLPLSFLFWSKAVQDTHSVADIFRGTLFASLTAYVAPPSLDSFVSSLLALGGCLIYAKEVNGSLEDILFPKKAGHGERKKKQSNLGIAQ